MEHTLSPCTLIIFGSTGDLSRVKLMPALYHLEAAGRLPESCPHRRHRASPLEP
jgi:glucose-6-phosphate 1-dehydrogenase